MCNTHCVLKYGRIHTVEPIDLLRKKKLFYEGKLLTRQVLGKLEFIYSSGLDTHTQSALYINLLPL